MELPKYNRPIRILHVVGGMNRGGVETWLMHVLRNIDRDKYRMDFLVHTEEECAYDDEIRRLGSRIIPCMRPSRPWQYVRNLRRILREGGPYDVVHSHTHHFSGLVLWAAAKEGIPTRIAHSHNDTTAIYAKDPIWRQFYYRLMRNALDRYATLGIGCSLDAAAALFGRNWKLNSRNRIIYCGIDLTPYRQKVDSVAIRDEIGIPDGAFVVGHVGSFTPQKNHAFFVNVAAEIVKQRSDAHFLLIGDGPDRVFLEEKVRLLGLEQRFTFAGVRSDVPRIMMGALDVFLFPSNFEGLGLVLIEAQAAGLPCVISDVVPAEATVNTALVTRLSLQQSASEWAAEVVRQFEQLDATQRLNSHAHTVALGRFSIEESVAAMCEAYTQTPEVAT